MFVLKLEATMLHLSYKDASGNEAPLPDMVNRDLAEQFRYETKEFRPGSKYSGKAGSFQKVISPVYNAERHCIPWGLTPDIIDFLEGYSIFGNIELHDTGHVNTGGRVRPLNYNRFHGELSLAHTREPFYYQSEAVKAAIAGRYGYVTLPTAAGKTECMAMLIEKLKPRVTLVAVDGSHLLEQTYKTFSNRFPRATIKQWNSTASTRQQKEAAIWYPDEMTIIIASYRSFDKFTGSPIAAAIDLVLMDEIQKITCEDYAPVVDKTPYAYARIGFSATPFRDDNSTMLVKGHCGPELYVKELKDLVVEGFVAKPVIKVANLFCTRGVWWLINRARTNKVVCFHEQTKKGIATSEMIIRNVIETWPPEYKVHGEHFLNTSWFIHSQKKGSVTELAAFANSATGCVFTTPLMDVGVDIPDIDTVILMQVRGQRSGAVVQNIQRIGRAMRVPPHQRGTGKEALVVIQQDPEEYVDEAGHVTIDYDLQPETTGTLYRSLTVPNRKKVESGYYRDFVLEDPFLSVD